MSSTKPCHLFLFYVEIPCYIFSLIYCTLTYIITTAPPLNLPLPSLPLAALLKNSLNTFLAFRLFMTYFKNSSCHFDFATLILLFFSLWTFHVLILLAFHYKLVLLKSSAMDSLYSTSSHWRLQHSLKSRC